MRALLGLATGAIAYIVSVPLIFLFFYWFLDKPEEWPYFIPIVTALMSIGIAAGTAEEVSGSKKTGAVLTVLIGVMWVCFVVADIVGNVSDIIHAIMGHSDTSEAGAFDLFMIYFDTILSSKIFAVVSGLAAFGEFEEMKK